MIDISMINFPMYMVRPSFCQQNYAKTKLNDKTNISKHTNARSLVVVAVWSIYDAFTAHMVMYLN